MTRFQKRTIQNDIVQTEQRLRQIEHLYGKTSEKYETEQRKLVRLWAMLKLMHQKEAFLKEVLEE